MNNTTYYNLKDISVLIKTPIPYLRKMIQEHKLIASYIDKQYVVSNEDLKTYINSCKGAKNEK